MYDSIIIGTGPAGLSAALNLKTYKKDFIWFGSKNLSEKVQKAEKITNYPGFPQGVSRQRQMCIRDRETALWCLQTMRCMRQGLSYFAWV